MAPTNNPSAVAPFGAITIYRAVTVLWNAAERLQRWNDTRRTINALRGLNAATLNDIGLTRDEVEEFERKAF